MSTTSRQVRAVLLVILAWHFVCLVMTCFYRDVLARFVYAAYVAQFGDIQKSYALYDHFAWLLVTLIPANLLALWLFHPRTSRSADWKSLGRAFCIWLIAVMVVVTLDHFFFGLSWQISQLMWALFGVPENLYTFYNLVLPHLLAWLILTTPIAWAALSLCANLGIREPAHAPVGTSS